MTTVAQRAADQASEVLAQMAAEEPALRDILGRMFGRASRWRYYGQRGAYGHRSPGNLYFYSTERVSNKFQSGIFRYIKSRRMWKPTDIRRHAKRKDAKARAKALYEAAQKEE